MLYHFTPCARSGRLRSLALALVVWGGGLTGAAGAQVLNEDLKILPADAAAGDQFGYRAALHNGLLVVGAVGDDNVGVDSGSAYVFDTTIDAPGGAQVLHLTAGDGAAGDNFGCAVALGGGMIGVGANANDDLGDASGSAYLFDALTGQPIVKLLPPDGVPFALFGNSIAFDGVLVAVGAHGDDDNGTSSGSVYLFDASVEIFDNGAFVRKLLPGDGATLDQFGYAVDMDAGVVAVGAYGDDAPDINSGSVYLFDAGTGLQLHKLVPSDGARDDRFGTSVALSGGLVLVGSPGDDDNGSESGSAYLFDAGTGLQLHKLVPGDGSFNQQFGQAVAMHDGLVAVTAMNDDDNGANSGSAYLFNAGTGAFVRKVLPSDGGTPDQFGTSVAVEGDVIAVGAWQDQHSATFAGSAYLFTASCPADLNGDGVVDNGDLGAFIALFLAGSPAVDFNNDGIIDNGDIIAFIAAFLAGC